MIKQNKQTRKVVKAQLVDTDAEKYNVDKYDRCLIYSWIN